MSCEALGNRDARQGMKIAASHLFHLQETDMTSSPPRDDGARIDPGREQDLERWARELDASKEQIKEAVRAVGPRASDVEEHLKGSRSTTNSERVHDAMKQKGSRPG
jgi:hypothetical protein